MKQTVVVVFLLFVPVLFWPVCSGADDFCIECHGTAELGEMVDVLSRRASIYQEVNTACPALREIKQEVFFTESRLLRTALALRAFERRHWYNVDAEKERLARASAAFAQVLAAGAPVHSVGQVASELGAVRFRANKVYQELNRARDEVRRRKLVGFTVVGLGVLFLSTLLGLKHAYKGKK